MNFYSFVKSESRKSFKRWNERAKKEASRIGMKNLITSQALGGVCEVCHRLTSILRGAYRGVGRNKGSDQGHLKVSKLWNYY